MELKKGIIEAFQASSIILVFVTLLFGLKYQTIINTLNREEPVGELAKKREKGNLIQSFFKNCFPQLIFYVIASYLFAPLAVEIMSQTTLSFWNFDFLITSYIIVTFWIWSILIWMMFLSYKLLSKISRLK